MSLTGILQNLKAVFCSECVYSVKICQLAVEMYGNDAACTRSQEAFKIGCFGTNQCVRQIYVAKNRTQPCLGDC